MTELWALKVGDAVYPAPSRHEAEAKERELVNFLASLGNDVPTVAVQLWTGTASEHQLGLAEWAPARAN